MDSNNLLTRTNDEGSNLVHGLIHLVEPHSWNIEEVTVPWMEAEEKLGRFQEIRDTWMYRMTTVVLIFEIKPIPNMFDSTTAYGCNMI